MLCYMVVLEPLWFVLWLEGALVASFDVAFLMLVILSFL
jgi:hypothetical protein